MATVKATITLTSSDLTSDALSLTHNQTMTLTQGGITRYSVTGTGVGTAYTLYTASDQTGPVYMYIKNTDATATDLIKVFADDADDTIHMKLRGGEAAWMTLEDSVTYKVFGTTAETIIEYGIFA